MTIQFNPFKCLPPRAGDAPADARCETCYCWEEGTQKTEAYCPGCMQTSAVSYVVPAEIPKLNRAAARTHKCPACDGLLVRAETSAYCRKTDKWVPLRLLNCIQAIHWRDRATFALAAVEKPEEFVCEVCGFITQDADKLANHVSARHPEKTPARKATKKAS